MSSLYLSLKRAALALSVEKDGGVKSPVNREDNPAMASLMWGLGLLGPISQGGQALKASYDDIVEAISRRFDYYDEAELEVNSRVDEYLNELVRMSYAEKPTLPELRSVAVTVCALGNRTRDAGCRNGVGKILEQARSQLEWFSKETDREVPNPHFLSFQRDVDSLEFLEGVLRIVDTFVASQFGMLHGLEEFSPAAIATPLEVPEPDFEEKSCGQEEDCTCGCKLDHGITLLEGLEDMLNGQVTYASRYVEGVAMSQGVRMGSVTGNEGAILDGIKAMGENAYKTLVESLKAVMDVISPSDSEEVAKKIRETADTNKKALQAMPERAKAEVNDAAKAGIIKLANNTYPNGEMTPLVKDIGKATQGGAIIDKLLGLLTTEVAGGGPMREKQKEAQTALDELKKASSAASGADETNKDVVAAAKEKVNEKIKAAREALKETKAAVKGHNKRLSGIRQAISGISPKIFTKGLEKTEPEPAKKEGE